MSEQKKCKQCGTDFEITDQDLEFLEKISPEFAGKKYLIPAPSLCYECRLKRRMSWRNERNLYLRKCDKSGQQIVAVYPEDSEYKVYSPEEWWKDDWDAMHFGTEFDETRSFFQQFSDLQRNVPRISLINQSPENSQYLNQASQNRDSYMSFDAGWNEKAFYSRTVYKCKNVTDCFNCRNNCEYLYECINCQNTNLSTFCLSCNDSSNCHYCYDLKNCQDCILSSNLQNKQYFFENKQYSREEYEAKKSALNLDSYHSRKELSKKYEKLIEESIHRFADNFKVENCLGNNLTNCKDLNISFGANKCENGKFLFYSEGMKDSFDDNYSGGEGSYELNYETIGCYQPYNCKFNFSCWGNISNLLYCDFCHSSKDCFGCVGLRNKQYCIFNKQYSKEEYEAMVGKIIDKMVDDGEWGEFFPTSISPFAYNETVANDYFPMSENDIKEAGYKWKAKTDNLTVNQDYVLPDSITQVDTDLLNKVLACEKTGRPYKIQPQELAFYVEQNIPVPHLHPDQRYAERLRLLPPLKLYHRKCMNEGCEVEFETTYAPDRPEKVYCEKCYQQCII